MEGPAARPAIPAPIDLLADRPGRRPRGPAGRGAPAVPPATGDDPVRWALAVESALAHRRLAEVRRLLEERPPWKGPLAPGGADALTAEAGFWLFDHAPARAEAALEGAVAFYDAAPGPSRVRGLSAVFHALAHARRAELRLHRGEERAAERELDESLRLLARGPRGGRVGAWALAVQGAALVLRGEVHRHRFDRRRAVRAWAGAVRASEAAARRWPALSFARAEAARARGHLASLALWAARLGAADREIARSLARIEEDRRRDPAALRPTLGAARAHLVLGRLRLLRLRPREAGEAFRVAEMEFRRALELQPGSAPIRGEIALALAGEGTVAALGGVDRLAGRRLEEAVALAEEATRLSPVRPELFSLLTRVHLARAPLGPVVRPAFLPRSALRGALAAGRRAARLGGADSRYRRDCANALRACGRAEASDPAAHASGRRHLREAASILAGILRSNPRDIPAHFRLAIVLTDLIGTEPGGRDRRAVEALRRAAEAELDAAGALLPTGFVVPSLRADLARAYRSALGPDLRPVERRALLVQAQRGYRSALRRAPGLLPALSGLAEVSAELAQDAARSAAARREDAGTARRVTAALRDAGIRAARVLPGLDPSGGFMELIAR